MAENQKKSSSEIDLLDLFSAMGRGIATLFRKILDIFLFLFVFGLRKIHWLVLIGIVGAITGYMVFSKTPRIYSSEMIAQPNGFTCFDMAQYINDIHEMCVRGNSSGIAAAFKIPEESARHIKNVQAFYFIDINEDGYGDYVDYKSRYNPADTTQAIVQNRILIQAKVLDKSSFNEIKEGLNSYIEQHPYLFTLNKIKKQELTQMIAQISSEIRKLDSLQNVEYFQSSNKASIQNESQIVFLSEKPMQLYYRDKDLLLVKQLGFERSLEFAKDPVTIVKDFAELQGQSNPYTPHLIKYGLLFIVIGYFFLLIIYNIKAVISYLDRKG